MSLYEKVLDVLDEGPATSGEVSIELGEGHRKCSAAMYKLWQQGRLERSCQRIPREGLMGAYLYLMPSHARYWRGALAKRGEVQA